jgi:type III restriction enzyme
MNEIALLPFQIKASNAIAERHGRLVGDKNRPYYLQNRPVPFYQALSALTGAGKTPILADAVAQLRTGCTSEPVILWISKAKAVIDQTRANFETGGKYAHLLPGFQAMGLSEVSHAQVRDATCPLLILATVGSFNQRDREDGSLRVHRVEQDVGADALWKVLRERSSTVKGSDSGRRPLIIVYDEAHNLTDQQADLLLDLEPDAFLGASATMKTPGRLGRLIDHLRDAGWDDESLVTTVASRDVVDAGLVKKQIVLGGYATAMEPAIDDMLGQMSTVEKKASALNAPFRPRAIYVCKTNISQLDGTRDNPGRPFIERQAPPILIWRYLVEKKGVDPASIAVYCDLKVDRRSKSLPESFVLFSGGDEDFSVFSAGSFQHVIFNQSLQEGWDDPACCFAYVDKSMGSAIQVEQVIGRVLRQPGAKHYPDVDLNSAHFFIRIDSKQAFPDILAGVRDKIGTEVPEIRISGYADARDRGRVRCEPKKQRTIPSIHINVDLPPVFAEVARIHDYSNDRDNTVGKGERLRAIQMVGSSAIPKTRSEQVRHSNRVMARWILRRRVQELYPVTSTCIDWTLRKFDAKVEMTSPAADALRESALRVVDKYVESSELVLEEENPYAVGPVIVDPRKKYKFKNSLHDQYSDLNDLELRFARALDEVGVEWVRNPQHGGYKIPLLVPGGPFNFFPDFLAWKGGVLFALDPKGEHLITADAGRKLLNISNEGGKARVLVRLVTEGQWDSPAQRKSSAGFSLWALKSGAIKPRHFGTLQDAVEAAMKAK